MTRQEMVKLLKFFNSYYQQKFEYPKEDKSDTKMMIETWYMFLGGYDYDVVRAAAKKIAMNKEWPPTPGEVAKQIEQLLMSEEDEITGPEAWQLILDAISRYSAIYNPDKVLESLPENVRKTAQVVGLRKIAFNDEADTFLRNSFINIYEDIKQHDFEKRMLPGSVRKDIEKLKRPETEKLADKFTNQRET